MNLQKGSVFECHKNHLLHCVDVIEVLLFDAFS